MGRRGNVVTNNAGYVYAQQLCKYNLPPSHCSEVIGRTNCFAIEWSSKEIVCYSLPEIRGMGNARTLENHQLYPVV